VNTQRQTDQLHIYIYMYIVSAERASERYR
jgi:hypothetical protein